MEFHHNFTDQMDILSISASVSMLFLWDPPISHPQNIYEPSRNMKENLQPKLSEIQLNSINENLPKIKFSTRIKLKQPIGNMEVLPKFSNFNRYPLRDFSLPKGSYIRQEVNKLKFSERSNKVNENVDSLNRRHFLQNKAVNSMPKDNQEKNYSDEKFSRLNFSFLNDEKVNATSLKELKEVSKNLKMNLKMKTSDYEHVTTPSKSDNTNERLNGLKINKNNLNIENRMDLTKTLEGRQQRFDLSNQLNKMSNRRKEEGPPSINRVGNEKLPKLQANQKTKKYSFSNLKYLNLNKQNPLSPKVKNITGTNEINSDDLDQLSIKNESREFEPKHRYIEIDPYTLDILKMSLINATEDKFEEKYQKASADRRVVASIKNLGQYLKMQVHTHPHQNTDPRSASTWNPQAHGHGLTHGNFHGYGIKTPQQQLQSQSQQQPSKQNASHLQFQVPCMNLQPQHFEIKSANTKGGFQNFRIVNEAFPVIIKIQNSSTDNDFVPHQDDNSKYSDENENMYSVPFSVVINSLPTAKLLQKAVVYADSNIDNSSSPQIIKKTIIWNSMINNLETVSDLFNTNFSNPCSIVCNSVNCSIIPCLQALQIMPQVYTSLFNNDEKKNTTMNQVKTSENMPTNVSPLSDSNPNTSVTAKSASPVTARSATVTVAEPFQNFHQVEAFSVQAKHSNNSDTVGNLTKEPLSEHTWIKTVHKSSRPEPALINLPLTNKFALGSRKNIYYPTQPHSMGYSFVFYSPETTTYRGPLCPSIYPETYAPSSAVFMDKPQERQKFADSGVTLRNVVIERRPTLKQMIFPIKYTDQPNEISIQKMPDNRKYKNAQSFIEPNKMVQNIPTQQASEYNETVPYVMINNQILTQDNVQQKPIPPKPPFLPSYWIKNETSPSDDDYYYYVDQLDEGSLPTTGMSTASTLCSPDPFCSTHSNFSTLNRQNTISRSATLKFLEEDRFTYTTTDRTTCELNCPQKSSYQFVGYNPFNPRIDSTKKTTKNWFRHEKTTENENGFGKSTLRDWLSRQTKVAGVNWSTSTKSSWTSCVPCDIEKLTTLKGVSLDKNSTLPDSISPSHSTCTCITGNSQSFPQSDFTFPSRINHVTSPSAYFTTKATTNPGQEKEINMEEPSENYRCGGGNSSCPTKKQRVQVGDNVSELVLRMPQNLPKLTLVFRRKHQKSIKTLNNYPNATGIQDIRAENVEKSSDNTDTLHLKIISDEKKVLANNPSSEKELQNRTPYDHKSFNSTQGTEKDHDSYAAPFMRLKRGLSSYRVNDFILGGDLGDMSAYSGRLHLKHSESLQTNRSSKSHSTNHHSHSRAKYHHHHATSNVNHKYSQRNNSFSQNKTNDFHLQPFEQKFKLANSTNFTKPHNWMRYLSTMIWDHPQGKLHHQSQHKNGQRTSQCHKRKDECRQFTNYSGHQQLKLQNKLWLSDKKQNIPMEKQLILTSKSKKQKNSTKLRGLMKCFEHFKTQLSDEKKAQHFKIESEHSTTRNEVSSSQRGEFLKEILEPTNATSSTSKFLANTTFLFDEDEVMMKEKSDSVHKNDAKSSRLSAIKSKYSSDFPWMDSFKEGKATNTMTERTNAYYNLEEISSTGIPNVTSFSSSNSAKMGGKNASASQTESTELEESSADSAEIENQSLNAPATVKLRNSAINTSTAVMKSDNELLDEKGTTSSRNEMNFSLKDTEQSLDRKLPLSEKNQDKQLDDHVRTINSSESVLGVGETERYDAKTTSTQNKRANFSYLSGNLSVLGKTRNSNLFPVGMTSDFSLKNGPMSAAKSKHSKLNKICQEDLTQSPLQNIDFNERSDVPDLCSLSTYVPLIVKINVENIAENESTDKKQQKKHHSYILQKKCNRSQKKKLLSSSQVCSTKQSEAIPDLQLSKKKKQKQEGGLLRRKTVYAHVHGAFPFTVDDTKIYHAVKVPSSLITPYLNAFSNFQPQSSKKQNISAPNTTSNILNQKQMSNSCNFIKNGTGISDAVALENKNLSKTDQIVRIPSSTHDNLSDVWIQKLGSDLDDVQTTTPSQEEKVTSQENNNFKEILKLREKLMGNDGKENPDFFSDRKTEGNSGQLSSLEKYTGSILHQILLPYFDALRLVGGNNGRDENSMTQIDTSTQTSANELNDQLKEREEWIMHDNYNTPYDAATNADAFNLKLRTQNEGEVPATPRMEDQFGEVEKFGQLKTTRMTPQNLNKNMGDQNIYRATQNLDQPVTLPAAMENSAKGSFTLLQKVKNSERVPVFLMPDQNKWRTENASFNSWQHNLPKGNSPPLLDFSAINHQLADAIQIIQRKKENSKDLTKYSLENRKEQLPQSSDRNTTSSQFYMPAMPDKKYQLFNLKTVSPHLHFCSPRCKNNNCSMVCDFDSYVPICKKRVSIKTQNQQATEAESMPKFKFYYITIKPNLIPRLSQYIQSFKNTTAQNIMYPQSKLPTQVQVQTTNDASSAINSTKEFITNTENQLPIQQLFNASALLPLTYDKNNTSKEFQYFVQTSTIESKIQKESSYPNIFEFTTDLQSISTAGKFDTDQETLPSQPLLATEACTTTNTLTATETAQFSSVDNSTKTLYRINETEDGLKDVLVTNKSVISQNVSVVPSYFKNMLDGGLHSMSNLTFILGKLKQTTIDNLTCFDKSETQKQTAEATSQITSAVEGVQDKNATMASFSNVSKNLFESTPNVSAGNHLDLKDTGLDTQELSINKKENQCKGSSSEIASNLEKEITNQIDVKLQTESTDRVYTGICTLETNDSINDDEKKNKVGQNSMSYENEVKNKLPINELFKINEIKTAQSRKNEEDNQTNLRCTTVGMKFKNSTMNPLTSSKITSTASTTVSNKECLCEVTTSIAENSTIRDGKPFLTTGISSLKTEVPDFANTIGACNKTTARLDIKKKKDSDVETLPTFRHTKITSQDSMKKTTRSEITKDTSTHLMTIKNEALQRTSLSDTMTIGCTKKLYQVSGKKHNMTRSTLNGNGAVSNIQQSTNADDRKNETSYSNNNETRQNTIVSFKSDDLRLTNDSLKNTGVIYGVNSNARDQLCRPEKTSNTTKNELPTTDNNKTKTAASDDHSKKLERRKPDLNQKSKGSSAKELNVKLEKVYRNNSSNFDYTIKTDFAQKNVPKNEKHESSYKVSGCQKKFDGCSQKTSHENGLKNGNIDKKPEEAEMRGKTRTEIKSDSKTQLNTSRICSKHLKTLNIAEEKSKEIKEDQKILPVIKVNSFLSTSDPSSLDANTQNCKNCTYKTGNLPEKEVISKENTATAGIVFPNKELEIKNADKSVRNFWKSKLSSTSRKMPCATIKCSSAKIRKNLKEAVLSQNTSSTSSQCKTESIKVKSNGTYASTESFSTAIFSTKSFTAISSVTKFFDMINNTQCVTSVKLLNNTRENERTAGERKNVTQTLVPCTNTQCVILEKGNRTEKMNVCLGDKNRSNFLTTLAAKISNAQAILRSRIFKGSTKSGRDKLVSITTPITESTPRHPLTYKTGITTPAMKTDCHQRSTMHSTNTSCTATYCYSKASTRKNSKAPESQTRNVKMTTKKLADSSKSTRNSFHQTGKTVLSNCSWQSKRPEIQKNSENGVGYPVASP